MLTVGYSQESPYWNTVNDLDVITFGQPTAFYFQLDSMKITVKDSVFTRMTEDELKDWFILYIMATNTPYYSSDSISGNFFDRSITIVKSDLLESLCRKYLPQWIYDLPINRKETQ